MRSIRPLTLFISCLFTSCAEPSVFMVVKASLHSWLVSQNLGPWLIVFTRHSPNLWEENKRLHTKKATKCILSNINDLFVTHIVTICVVSDSLSAPLINTYAHGSCCWFYGKFMFYWTDSFLGSHCNVSVYARYVAAIATVRERTESVKSFYTM